jgi:hypothetical protein
VSAYTRARVDCDYFNRDAPTGQKLCYEQVEEGWTKVEARRAAKKLGWLTGVRPDRSGHGSSDFCPKHKSGDTS